MKPLFAASCCLLALAAGSAAADQPVRSVVFTATPAPAGPDEMVVAATRSAAVVTYADGRSKTFPLRLETLMRSGDRFGTAEAGLIVDAKGQSIGSSGPEGARGPFHARAPDANSLLATKAGPLLVTHFEYHTESPAMEAGKAPLAMYGRLPMVMTAARLHQDKRSGSLTVRDLQNIDMAGIDGLWIPCAGTLTPWNSHLGGEEYEPDGRTFQGKPLEAMNLFLGTPGKTAADGGAKPYRYGHLVEISAVSGKPVATKRYATGRLSFELADIQEDGRTAYFGDDGRDVVLFMFVADRVADLSAGTLYAARWTQTDGAGAGAAALAWIRLGHAEDAEIKALVDGGIGFTDIFETADRPAEGFVPIYVYPGTGAKNRLEYLKVKPGMEQAAAFLESRRFAALRGATAEFTKMEGQTHDPAGRKLFTAMSYVEEAMLDGKNGERPSDHIRLAGDAKDLICGGVYHSSLKRGQVDSDGQPIASDWVAADMTPVVLGAKRPDGTGNGHDKCDTDKVANPDNLKFSPAMRTLFIGEDSGNHVNNFLWAYNVDSGSLTRLAWAPVGAEWSGLAVVESLGGHGYIFGNLQHPGAAEDLAKYPDEVKVGLRARVDQRGAVGYLGGLPALGGAVR